MKLLVKTILLSFVCAGTLQGQEDSFKEFNKLVFSYLLDAEKFYELPECNCSVDEEIRFYILRSGKGIQQTGLPGLSEHNILVLDQEGSYRYAAYNKEKVPFKQEKKFRRKFDRYTGKANFLSGWNMDPNYVIKDFDKYTGEVFLLYCEGNQQKLHYFNRGLGIEELDENALEGSKINLKYMNKLIDLFYNEFDLPEPMSP